MHTNQSIHLLLSQISSIKDKNLRLSGFRQLCLANRPVFELTAMAYDYRIQFVDLDREKSIQAIAKAEGGDRSSMMYKTIRTLPYLWKNAQIDDKKRERIWFNALDACAKPDAELLLSVVFDRKFPHRNLGEAFVRSAVPEIFE